MEHRSPDKNTIIDRKSNRRKFVMHGFFFSTAIHVAEPSTTLPLIIKFFTSSNVTIGLFSSLVRGGAVLMHLFMAYFAQSYKRVMRPLRILFFFRFLAWSSVGFTIFFLGERNPKLALKLVGLGLFLFSFVAGFGTILFHEVLGKIFTNKYRGVTWAYRQQFMALGGIFSAFLSAYIFYHFEKPFSFALVFLISGCVMAIGYLFLGSVKEYSKGKVNKREQNFMVFLLNSFKLLKTDKVLAYQIIVCFLSFSYLLVFPFIVTQAKIELKIAGLTLSSLIPFLAGSFFGNFMWGRLSKKGNDKRIVQLSFIFIIVSLFISMYAYEIYSFSLIYLFAGAAQDGFRLSFKNLVLGISPEEKRPVYFAVQNNLTSLAMFLSVPGGLVLDYTSLTNVTLIAMIMLLIGFVMSFKLVNLK